MEVNPCHSYDLIQLARSSDGLTGAEIEAVFNKAMFAAFERGKEPTDLDCAAVLNETVPLSKTMADQIVALKGWAKGRARPATFTRSSDFYGRKMVV